MSKKFESLDEIEKFRKELDLQYESGIPDYLLHFLDEEENRLKDNEYFRQRALYKASMPEVSYQELDEIKKEKEEKFWEENETQIVKKERRLGSDKTPVYLPGKQNEEIIEKEKNLSPEETKVLVDLCKDDLYLFAIRYFSHYLSTPSSEFHKWLYGLFSREFSSKKKRKKALKYAIAAPRGNAKSSIISNIFPIWCICYNKKKFILLISNTVSLSEEFLTDIKLELETNEGLLRDFPGVCGKGPRWRSNEIITKNDVKLLALGVGSQIRGRKWGIYRPGLVLCDDVDDEESIKSVDTMKYVKDTWFDKDVLYASGNKNNETDFIVLGSILGPNALLNHLLNSDTYPDWQSRKFASVIKFSTSELWNEWKELYNNKFDLNRIYTAEKFFEEHKEEMLKDTEVLWPEGQPYYDLMIELNKSESAFWSERQNNPKDPTKVKLHKEDLHWENFSTNPDVKKDIEHGKYYGSLDPSLGKKAASGDYSSISSVCSGKSGYVYVVDFDIKRRKVEKQIEAIIENWERFKYSLFGIETNAFQFVIYEMLSKQCRELGYRIPTEELQNYSDKKLRIEGLIPFIKDKTIVFDSQKYNFTKEYRFAVDQILDWTGEGDLFDDAIDSLEMAFRICSKKKFKLTCRRTKKD